MEALPAGDTRGDIKLGLSRSLPPCWPALLLEVPPTIFLACTPESYTITLPGRLAAGIAVAVSTLSAVSSLPTDARLAAGDQYTS